ncbi:PQQ-dependent sugar dehydrogenase [Halomonas sp. CUBES01]|uniref:PQQ-dependent sugar dehydrogenase n=1 Tax=Vreelandella gomseomensis TaxID=370766 RepID=A0ABU1G7J3_9GAMM|nr:MULTISPECIES: PQQ-dependent sugar dehydrogenase [Halomonas]MDR5873456.1 PQQ-dependent sugar dehydrogenase [Halomonas gomseomensis]MEC4768213.1 PQQ-dependent sugar dehydrogenase [Halomonas sp. CUBES01]
MRRLSTHALRQRWLTAALVGSLGSASVNAAEMVEERIESDQLAFSIEKVAGGLENPWAVAFLPDGRYLVSERPGRLNLIDDDGGERQVLEGLPEVSQRGQGGLLDVALHPAFGDGEHDWIYFTWSKPEGSNSRSALSRVKWQGDALGDVEHLFEQNRASSPGRHYGSRLAWLPDDTLLMSIGDRGIEPPRAQADDDHAGSTLRLTATGGVPDDNPFVGDATLDDIYTQGNRNIQGMVVRQNGEPWATEHGPRTGDELNRLTPGDNYGWPEVSRGNDYATNEPIGKTSKPGMVDPVHVFDGRFAPSGLAEVTSDAFGEWQGQLLAGGLGSQRLVRLQLEDNDVTQREVVLDGELGRIRDVRQGPDEAIYVLTDAADGALYRLRPVE